MEGEEERERERERDREMRRERARERMRERGGAGATHCDQGRFSNHNKFKTLNKS